MKLSGIFVCPVPESGGEGVEQEIDVTVEQREEERKLSELAALSSCLGNPVLPLISDGGGVECHKSICMLPSLGTLPNQTGKFSKMFGGLGESQFLDVPHLEEL